MILRLRSSSQCDVAVASLPHDAKTEAIIGTASYQKSSVLNREVSHLSEIETHQDFTGDCVMNAVQSHAKKPKMEILLDP